MSGNGAPDSIELDPADVADARVAIVASSWHTEVMDGLVAGASSLLAELGVDAVELVRSPGSFELPILADACALAGFDVVVALGVIIRGGTPHFEYVSDAATSGLTRVALDTGVPIGFGLLTCDNEQQAIERAGLPNSRESKGREAAEAALATWVALKAVRAKATEPPTID